MDSFIFILIRHMGTGEGFFFLVEGLGLFNLVEFSCGGCLLCRCSSFFLRPHALYNIAQAFFSPALQWPPFISNQPNAISLPRVTWEISSVGLVLYL